MKSKRQFIISPEDSNTAIIPLTQNKIALVDTADAIELCKYNWCASKGKNGIYYAVTQIDKKLVKMHRFIMKVEYIMVDHINHDGLDNRRSNLRMCTDSQNCQNKRDKYIGLSSNYRGVSKRESDGKFIAKIQHNKVQIYLGTFNTQEDAAKAYDTKAKELFNEFAMLNFPN